MEETVQFNNAPDTSKSVTKWRCKQSSSGIRCENIAPMERNYKNEMPNKETTIIKKMFQTLNGWKTRA